MTLTTTPNELTDGLEKALAPMNKIHVPVHEIAMMMSIALRFIPVSYTHLDTLKIARRCLPALEKRTLDALCGYYGIEIGHHPVSYTHLDVYKRQS